MGTQEGSHALPEQHLHCHQQSQNPRQTTGLIRLFRCVKNQEIQADTIPSEKHLYFFQKSKIMEIFLPLLLWPILPPYKKSFHKDCGVFRVIHFLELYLESPLQEVTTAQGTVTVTAFYKNAGPRGSSRRVLTCSCHVTLSVLNTLCKA